MKSNRRRIAAVAGAALAALLGAQLAVAVEQTGKIIENMVAEVDKQLTTLEEMSDKNEGEKERVKSALDTEYIRYEASTNSMQRAASRGDMVNLLARLNKVDRAEVDATVETSVNVIEALRKIQSAVQNSTQLTPEKLDEQKKRLGQYVKNAARIVRIAESAGKDPANRNRTVALKNSLIMLHKQLQDPALGTARALERVGETIRTLEDVAVQLDILRGMLESERIMLLTAANVQTVDLALLRLARAHLGTETIADIPGQKYNDVVGRIRKAREPITESDSILAATTEPFESGEWELLGSEEFTEIEQ
ncbi:MAG: hypothetical protein HY343_07815 [Lentisphaerae bacterium]|nr:hypothetical protein [Lentisphaerota bacterium]